MNNVNEVVRAMMGKKLVDVIVAGYVDHENGIARFHPLFDNVYFEFDDGPLVQLSSIDQFWNLRLKLVDEIRSEIAIDEDDEFCAGSIRHLTLRHPDADSVLRSLTLVVDSSDPGLATKCAVFEFHDPTGAAIDTVFVDPQHTYGLRFAGDAEWTEWRFIHKSATVYRAHTYVDTNIKVSVKPIV